MSTIWKYILTTADEQVVEMPNGAEILSCQMQGEDLYLWALVTPGADLKTRLIRIHGTGHPVPYAERLKFISTFQMHGGALIFHVFEVKS